MIRVGVFGAAGQMGRTVAGAIDGAEDLELVAVVDKAFESSGFVQLPHSTPAVGTDPSTFVNAGAQVVVDFSVATASRQNIDFCFDNAIHVVVGTTGFTDEDMARWRRAASAGSARGVFAANFAIGAVLMMKLAEIAAPHFDGVEIIELHHDNKKDAPSGTAMTTVARINTARKEAKGTWPPDPTEREIAKGARGARVEDIPVHSVRLRGLVAHQEVLFGTTGQSLTIRHDSYDRVSFMPGVLLSVRRVFDIEGVVEGLEALLW
jgi:4-hydroxy-tetrahydrodipicolinate reductase